MTVILRGQRWSRGGHTSSAFYEVKRHFLEPLWSRAKHVYMLLLCFAKYVWEETKLLPGRHKQPKSVPSNSGSVLLLRGQNGDVAYRPLLEYLNVSIN